MRAQRTRRQAGPAPYPVAVCSIAAAANVTANPAPPADAQAGIVTDDESRANPAHAPDYQAIASSRLTPSPTACTIPPTTHHRRPNPCPAPPNY